MSKNETVLIDLDAIKKEQVALEIQQLLSAEFGSSAVLVPEGFKLEDTERFQPIANSFRANLNFSDLPEWSRYIVDQGVQDGLAVCLIDPDKMTAVATLDRGTINMPGHCRHKASLRLKETPEYRAMLDINGEQNKLKSLADWIEDWAHCITGESTDAEVMDAKQLAHSVRKITVDTKRSSDHEVGDFSGSKSVLEQVEARNKERMPAFVFLRCKPYDDLNGRTFKLRVSVVASDSDPRIILRIVGLEQEKRSMALEFKGLVNKALETAPVKVYVGS